jgi:hypothetical protein
MIGSANRKSANPKNILVRNIATLYVNSPAVAIYIQLECPGNSVDTEFRLFFVLSSLPYSARNCLKSRGISYCIIRQNFADFRDFSYTKFCISHKGSYGPDMSRWSLAPV